MKPKTDDESKVLLDSCCAMIFNMNEEQYSKYMDMFMSQAPIDVINATYITEYLKTL